MNAIGPVVRTPWQAAQAAAPRPAPVVLDTVSLSEAAPARPSKVRRIAAVVGGLVSLMGAFAATPASAQQPVAASVAQTIPDPGSAQTGPGPGPAGTVPGPGSAQTGLAPAQTGPGPAQSLPGPAPAPRVADARTARTETFLRQWGDGLFDTRVPVGERLERATAPPTSPSAHMPFVVGNAGGAPPLSSLKGVGSLDELRARVDGYYGSNAPAFGQVALDMGARYGRDNYTYGVGGSVPQMTNALDLYNKQGGVCVEIHSAIAAYRASHGQEAYVVGSSSTGNAHAYVIFKDDGRWYVQNYGKVVQTDARNVRELFDRALPDEVRPQLYRPGADGSMQYVGRDFTTGTGFAERRFSDRAGSGAFDPFVESGAGITARGSQLTMFGERVHVGVDAATGEVSGGYLYRRDADAVAGFAARVQPQVGGADVKWESESRHMSASSFGRTRMSVFGGVLGHEPAPQYWDGASNRSIGRLGASLARNESTLHGEGAARLETGWDVRARAVWTYGLDEATRQASIGSQNGGSTRYFGDFTRMLGDASASAGVNAGLFYQPHDGLMVRSGVRIAENAANFVSTRVGQALATGFEPSAYAEAQWKPGAGVVAGGAVEVPLNDARSFRMASMIGWSPSERFTVGAGYTRQVFLSEAWDRARVGVSWSPVDKIDVMVGGEGPGFSAAGVRDLRADAGVRVRF